jgi:protein gp37
LARAWTVAPSVWQIRLPSSLHRPFQFVGGESGAGARPMEKAWVCEVREQCLANGVAFFFKHWGGLRAVKARWARMESQFLSLAGLAEMAAE